MDIEVLGISRKMLKSKMLREQVKQCSQFLDFTYNQKTLAIKKYFSFHDFLPLSLLKFELHGTKFRLMDPRYIRVTDTSKGFTQGGR